MFDYLCPGARMGLRTAVALESAALLQSVHVDVCMLPGPAARLLRRVAGPRVENRVVRSIPAARVRRHPQLMAAARIRRRLALAGRDTAPMDRMLVRIYSSIARQCAAEAVIGIQTGCLELFEGRTLKIMEQVSPPIRYERAVAAEELARFPGWAHPSLTTVSPRDRRMEKEWEAADLIWVPSRHLIDISREFGADPSKFRVTPYPIAGWSQPRAARPIGTARGLRVVFAGTLMLEKGVQYIYEALRKRPGLPIEMHFFGPSNLTALGLRRLAEVGTVHGHVPRSRLHDEFRRADVLLFPSLSEGSALVTLEATALGLPVVATGEAGAPASAMLISTRSPDAIISAIESLAADPGRLESLSAAGLAESGRRDFASYTSSVLRALGHRDRALRRAPC